MVPPLEESPPSTTVPICTRRRYDLEQLTVTIPALYEYREGRRWHDLLPEARPTFYDGDSIVNDLYSGTDYLLDYRIRPDESSAAESIQPVDSITVAGDYLLAITGISEKLCGTKLVPFVVGSNAALRKLMAKWRFGL